MTQARALLLLILAALMWSIGGVLIKSIALHPLAIAGLRSAIASIVLALCARGFKFTWSRTQLATAGFFAFTVISFVCATKMTTAANEILLQYTAPIYIIALSSPLLGEKIRPRDLVALSTIFAGMIIFFSRKFRLIICSVT